jgi:hypothetical protein
MVAILAA